jgi:hypothetical protein
MLSAHTLLVTAICVAYFGSMAGLILYACSTGTCRDADEDDPPDADGEGGGDDVLLAA